MGVTWGVSAWFHDAGLSVIKDNKIVFAAHAERYSGKKHDKMLNRKIIDEALKLIVKGILNPSDAKKAEILGVDAIYVSGHGSRQFDSCPIPIRQLNKIRKSLNKSTVLIYDTGIRNGEDILKALCLGADFVMIGKHALFSIAAEGFEGLVQMTNNLKKEIEIAMAQMGAFDINKLGPAYIEESSK